MADGQRLPTGLKNKIVTADEAVAIVQDGDMVAVSGFVGIGTPDELILALAKRFTEGKGPRDLGLMFAAAPGDGKDRGLNRLAIPGLIRRVVGGHWSLVPKLGAMAIEGTIEAYNLPLGVVSHLYRDIAAKTAGHITKVGLHTFVDPHTLWEVWVIGGKEVFEDLCSHGRVAAGVSLHVDEYMLDAALLSFADKHVDKSHKA